MISRRNFIITLSNFSFLVMGANISKYLAFRPPQARRHDCITFSPPLPDKDPYLAMRATKYYLFGSGGIGETLCDKIFQIHCKRSPNELSELEFAQRKDLHRNENKNLIIYVAGRADDADFRMNRYLAGSLNPMLLVTFVFGNNFQRIYNDPLLPFECQLHMKDSESEKTSLDIMNMLFDSLARPGLISMDFVDLKSILARKFAHGLSVRTSIAGGEADLKFMFKLNMEKLATAENTFCYFSFSDYDIITMYGISSLIDTVVDTLGNCNMVFGANVFKGQSTQLLCSLIVT